MEKNKPGVELSTKSGYSKNENKNNNDNKCTVGSIGGNWSV